MRLAYRVGIERLHARATMINRGRTGATFDAGWAVVADCADLLEAWRTRRRLRALGR